MFFMAKLVKTTIYIDGKEIKQFYQFSLSQAIFAHHSFKLVCPAEALDGPKGSLFANSKNFIGTSFKVKIEGYGDSSGQPLKFSGLVTQVEANKFSGHVGDVIISGFSPTILMDNGPHCNTWEKKAVKNIATDVFSKFPQNLLQPQIQPVYGETLAYTVQYRETSWQFLNRIAATFGEWFFYNGEATVMGLPKSKNAKLIYGSNLSGFSMALQLRPGNFEQVSYDYLNNATYKASPKNIEQKTGLNEIGKHVYLKSKAFFTNTPKIFNNAFFTNQKQLDDVTDTGAAAQSSNMVRFNGSSTHFGVQLGNIVSVSDNFGEFTIISVDHACDGQGNYSNDFVAIPSTIKVPPVTGYNVPVCETQTAIVTDNFDPKGLGRIRVRFQWMPDDQKTPWIRLINPHSGSGKGHYFIPELGEEAVIGFEAASPTKPYVLGTVYNGSANASALNNNAANDIKRIQTRSGHIIELDDANGAEKITIKDKSNNIIVLDTAASSIKISAPENINITAKNIDINAQENITIGAGQNISTYAGHDYTLAAKNITQVADNNFNHTASSIEKTADKIQMSSTVESIAMHSAGEIINKSGSKVKLF